MVGICHALLLISCTAPAGSSGLSATDKEYIQSLTQTVEENWNKGNREPYVNRFTSDAFYMAPNMESLVGKDAIKSFAASFPELKLEFTIGEIEGSSEFAYVRGGYLLKTPQDSLFDKGKFLSIWEKTPEKTWLLSHDMFSSDLPPTK
ncbi:MAG TPA: nuclear transport factor 2 family protein [Saprospiraceae bacterium]|nr:nuclear transport factor 2 family protein [Saprospiraceae bacterium]